jgi:hypothetical protein
MLPLLIMSLALAVPTAAAPAPDEIQIVLDRFDSVGGAVPTVLGAPVVAERAVRFDGVGDGLILPVNPLAGLAAFTVEVLLRPDTGGPEEQRFLHVEDEAGTRVLLELRVNPDGRWALDTFLRDGPEELPLVDRAKSHPIGVWHWVALRYDGRTLSHYVNGRFELEGAVAFRPMAPRGAYSLGVRLNRVSWFRGSIREVRFHRSALPIERLQSQP